MKSKSTIEVDLEATAGAVVLQAIAEVVVAIAEVVEVTAEVALQAAVVLAEAVQVEAAVMTDLDKVIDRKKGEKADRVPQADLALLHVINTEDVLEVSLSIATARGALAAERGIKKERGAHGEVDQKTVLKFLVMVIPSRTDGGAEVD